MNRGFKQIGISGPDAHDNQIAGMFIGTNPAATYGASHAHDVRERHRARQGHE